MSEKKHRRTVAEIQEAKLAPARAALRELDAGDIWQVVNEEIDRRRLDSKTGGTKDEPGQYIAAVVSLAAVLGIVDEQDRAMAERLAAVGRGASVAPETGSSFARELEAWVEAGVDASGLAKTFSKRLRRPVDQQKIAAALRRRRGPKQLEELAAAMGVTVRAEAVKKARRAIR